MQNIEGKFDASRYLRVQGLSLGELCVYNRTEYFFKYLMLRHDCGENSRLRIVDVQKDEDKGFKKLVILNCHT